MAVKKTDAALKADATATENGTHGVADPAPAAALEDASGAIIEPAITDAVDVSHESVDANPREGTTAAQNAIGDQSAREQRADHLGGGAAAQAVGQGQRQIAGARGGTAEDQALGFGKRGHSACSPSPKALSVIWRSRLA